MLDGMCYKIVWITYSTAQRILDVLYYYYYYWQTARLSLSADNCHGVSVCGSVCPTRVLWQDA